MKRALVLFGGLAVVLVAVNALVVSKERLLRGGERIYLELAPVDPRSLIQGDYMRLDYAVARDAREIAALPANGELVVRLDGRGVASLARLHRAGEALAPGEHLLRFRTRDGRVRVGSPSFFFQEGEARHYAGAKYGELRLADSGDTLLVGLRDADLRRLAPPWPVEAPGWP